MADYYFQGLSPHDVELLVRDLLHLAAHEADVLDLVESAIYPQQIHSVWLLGRSYTSLRLAKIIDALSERYWTLNEAPAIGMVLVRYQYGADRWRIEPESLTKRFLVLWDMVSQVEGTSKLALEKACADLLGLLESQIPDRRELVGVLERILRSSDEALGRDHALFEAALARAFQFDDYIELGEFGALAEFADNYPEVVTEGERVRLAEAFGETIDDEEGVIRQESDPDTKLAWFDELSAVASMLDVDLSLDREELESETYGDWDDDEARGWGRDTSSPSAYVPDSALDSLFGSLKGSRG